jgi:hypothetical protein
MTVQPDLFSAPPPRPSYPEAPGFKARDTSKAAAESMRPNASRLRQMTLRAIKESPDGLTADEAAAAVGEGILSIRPRVSEIAKTGDIIDTGRRRSNDSGRSAIVWRAV